MKNVDINVVIARAIYESDQRRLIARAAGIANALKAGVGPMIAGTMMEDDLREALHLKPDEMVNIPKGFADQTGDKHGA